MEGLMIISIISLVLMISAYGMQAKKCKEENSLEIMLVKMKKPKSSSESKSLVKDLLSENQLLTKKHKRK